MFGRVLWSNVHTVAEVMPGGRFRATFDRTNHTPESAFSTNEACNSEKRRVARPTLTPSVGDRYVEYYCLPDTVDPRAPGR